MMMWNLGGLLGFQALERFLFDMGCTINLRIVQPLLFGRTGVLYRFFYKNQEGISDIDFKELNREVKST